MNPRILLISLLLIVCALPPAITAADGIEAGWYVQANFERMRATPAGQRLYAWLEREVIDDLEAEFGEGIISRFAAVTVLAGGGSGLAVVLDGRLDEARREALIERFSGRPRDDYPEGTVYELTALGQDEDITPEGVFETGLFLVFGEDDRLLLTSGEAHIDRFLDGAMGPEIPAANLIVIRAADSLLRGGANTANLGGGFQSQMFNNINQAAIALSDVDGRFELRAELLAESAEKAGGLAGVAQGLISLHALSDGDEELAFLSTLEVATDDRRVDLVLSLQPDELIELLD